MNGHWVPAALLESIGDNVQTKHKNSQKYEESGQQLWPKELDVSVRKKKLLRARPFLSILSF